VVNGADLAIVSTNFNHGVTSWDQGDFYYAGVVNSPDLAAVAANYNQGISLPDVAATPVVASTASAVATSTAETTAAAPPSPKSKPVSVSKAVVSDTTSRKSKASAAAPYAASVVTIPTSGAMATPRNTNNKDAKFLADR
ncbi:MAG: hypothetical protein ABSC42_17220, partial [Tepidisphaeraceae bacterium]